MKKSSKKNKIESYTESDLNKIQSQSKTDWKRIDDLDDSEIDYTDIPELQDQDWASAKVVDHAKKAISLRVDMDVLDWYKHQGGRYQKLMNMVLRQYMNSHRRHRK